MPLPLRQAVHLNLKHTSVVQSALQNTQAVEEPLQARAGQELTSPLVISITMHYEEQRFIFFWASNYCFWCVTMEENRPTLSTGVSAAGLLTFPPIPHLL